MPGLVNKRANQYSWIRYINQRISNNKNFLCFVGGQTGSGKSWSCLSMCEMLDPEFNIDRVVFTGRELMKLINSNTLSKGSCVLFDESGIDLSNRNWQSTLNKMLNYLLQTFRHKCIILFFTSPYMDFLDASTRKLMHAQFEMISINKKEKKGIIKPKLIQYNGNTGKYYYKYLRVVTKDGTIPIETWGIPKPNNKLIKDYEAKKIEFTSSLNKKIEEELDKLDGIKKPKPLTEQQQTIFNHLKEGKTGNQIAKIMNIHHTLVYRQMQYMRKKGCDI